MMKLAVSAAVAAVVSSLLGETYEMRRPSPIMSVPAVARAVLDLELEPPAVNAEPGSDYRFDHIGFVMNAGMALTRGGRLFAVWHAGEDGPGCFLVGTWSDDGGRTWTDTRLVVGQRGPILPIGASGKGVYRSVLIANVWSAPDGTLRLYAYHAMNAFSGRGTLWEIVCRNPDAERPVWDAPRFLAWGASHNKPIVLRDGTWLLPNDFEDFAVQPAYFPELDPQRGCGFLASTDAGRTWIRRGWTRPKGTRHYAENMVVELADGRLRQLMRTGLGLMSSESSDGGLTWTTPAQPDNLRQVISRFGFIRLASGHLLFVKNGDAPDRVDGNRRDKLTVFASDDEGRTWKGGLTLDGRRNVSYPDVFQAPDGSVYVSYDHDRGTKRDELLFAKFTEADVLAGRLVTAGSSLTNRIFAVSARPVRSL